MASSSLGGFHAVMSSVGNAKVKWARCALARLCTLQQKPGGLEACLNPVQLSGGQNVKTAASAE